MEMQNYNFCCSFCYTSILIAGTRCKPVIIPQGLVSVGYNSVRDESGLYPVNAIFYYSCGNGQEESKCQKTGHWKPKPTCNANTNNNNGNKASIMFHNE